MSKSKKTAGKTAKIVKTGRPVNKENAKVKSLYPVSKLTKNSAKNLWVAYPASSPSKGLVFSSTLSADKARNFVAKSIKTTMSNINICRVGYFRKKHA